MKRNFNNKKYIIAIIVFFFLNFHLANAECPGTYPDGLIACEDFEDNDYSDSFGWDNETYYNLTAENVNIITTSVTDEYATVSSPTDGTNFLAGQWNASGSYNIPGTSSPPASGNHQLRLQKEALYSGTSLNWSITDEYFIRYYLRLSGAGYSNRCYTEYNCNDVWDNSTLKLLHTEYARDNYCVQAFISPNETYAQWRGIDVYADQDYQGTTEYGIDTILDDGTWHKIEIYTNIGTVGNNQVVVWIDDIEKFDGVVPDEIENPYEIGGWYNYYDGDLWAWSSPWYVDNLEFWGDLGNPNINQLRDGTIGESSDTTPPSAPSGLSVS